MRSSSASRKLRLEKLQHVLERCWSLMLVMGFSFTVVKTKPSSFGASCATAVRDIRPSAAISTDFLIIW